MDAERLGQMPATAPYLAVGSWLRVPVFTAAAVTLGVLAHLWAGGAAPRPGTLILLIAAVASVCMSVAHRENRLPDLVIGVTAVQVAVHVALLEHQVDAHPPQHQAVMMLAHAVAALTLAWWLRRGEAAVWRAARWMLRRLFLPGSTPPAPAISGPQLAAPRPQHRLAAAACWSVWTIRGPPTWA
jgi:hypothetical protein